MLLSGVRKKDDWSQCLVVSPGDMDPAVADMMGEGLFACSLQLSLLSLFLRQSGTQTADTTGGRKCLLALTSCVQVTPTGASTGTCAWTRPWQPGTGAEATITARTSTASPLYSPSSGCSTRDPSQVQYDYVKFCQLSLLKLFSDWASSKVHFCQKLILPKTVLAGKYIMLYRKLAQNNGLIVV